MAKPVYLGLEIVGGRFLIKTWWDTVVVVFLLFSLTVGISYLTFRIGRSALRWWRARDKHAVIPSAVAKHLEQLRKSSKRLSKIIPFSPAEELKSFGVYLGSFDYPPTSNQARLLSQWDVLVLDPLQPGVLDALATYESPSTHILGRIDMRALTQSESSSSSGAIIRAIDALNQTLSSSFRSQYTTSSPYTGVLLAEFITHFPPVVLNEVAKTIKSFGLDLWLEMSPPAYLSDKDCRDIDMENIRGVVCRNGTILSNGDRRNFFQMKEMRTAQRGIAAHLVRHGPPMMMWETIDDGLKLDYAVVKRSYDWCRYNTILPWIGAASALTNSEMAATHSMADKPLGALMWLKNDSNMTAHNFWRANNKISNGPLGHDELFDTLESFVPDLAGRLQLSPPDSRNQLAITGADIVDGLDWLATPHHHVQPDPFSISIEGDDLSGLGCFQLGLEVDVKDYADVLQAQCNLKELNLLTRAKAEELREIAEQIQVLNDASLLSPRGNRAVIELLHLLSNTTDDKESRFQVHLGLHSGFQTSAEIQFWGLQEENNITGTLDMYVSLRTLDRAGTILHTFLSAQGCTRTECFLAEITMAQLNNNLSKDWQLPQRLVRDIEMLSPRECILFLRRIISSRRETDPFFAKVRSCCEYQLMDIPTLQQQRNLAAIDYLGGDISAEEVVMARLAWHREKGCWQPDPAEAISVFKEIDLRLEGLLMTGQSDIYAQISHVIQVLSKEDQIDAAADIFALAIFCAFRRLSLNEIFVEVLDRNVYPNWITIQAGVFAENFALGSRCDSFFDCTPMALGKIIAARTRVYYMENQPPAREDNFTELPTTYAAMQVDVDTEAGKEKASAIYQITFLGIFAVPALIDIMLLTTIGRGLYLTTFMEDYQKTMATTALMMALATTGAVGSWISSGGSYYLYANAFQAMNMFVLTRFAAGIAIILVAGLSVMVGLMVSRGVIAGLVFIFYFSMLTTYLLCLSALSIYQVPGNSFLSGRQVIMSCIPILFISPILSLFIQHDIAVYVCVLSVFLLSLLWSARRAMTQWQTWYYSIPTTTDTEVVNWFVERRNHGKLTSEDKTGAFEDIAMSPQPRQELHNAVLKEVNRRFWQRSDADPFVKKLAKGYDATNFLLGWYSRFKRSNMPLVYSGTWNLTLKAAMENMGNMQKGLKLHSAFLHWRHTGRDIWCGFLYFIVALLDKWAALVSGGALVGLSAASSEEYRLAVGFGLCYYLIGAVSLDTVSQPLWEAAQKTTAEPILSLEYLREVTANDTKARRKLFWQNFFKFFCMHISGVAITSALMWLFESSRDATIMYLAYIGAYSGLLFYQYNKIWCQQEAARPLAIAAIIGFPIGVAIHIEFPTFAYSGVIALSIGTWIAAIHSISISKIGWPMFSFSKHDGAIENNRFDVDGKLQSYFCSSLEPYPDLSQATLSKLYEHICSLPDDERYKLESTQNPGSRVMEILLHQSKSTWRGLAQDAFPSAESMIQMSGQFWTAGKTVVELISAAHLPYQDQKIRSLSRYMNGQLHLFVILGADLGGNAWNQNIHRNCRMVAEAIVQSTAEAHMNMSHDHAMLVELLAAYDLDGQELSLPEGIKYQLESSSVERVRYINHQKKILLRYLLLGLDVEKEWDSLPKPVRIFLLKRCNGQSPPLSMEIENWIRARIPATDTMDVDEFIARSDLGAFLTSVVGGMARALQHERGNSDDLRIQPPSGYEKLVASVPTPSHSEDESRFDSLGRHLNDFHHKVQTCLKFFVLSLTADPEYQRELNYNLQGSSPFIRWPVTILLNSIWSFCKFLQGIILPVILLSGRKEVVELSNNMKFMKTVIEKNRIVVESLIGPSTCFLQQQSDGSQRLSQYNGRHDSEPGDRKQLMAINTYSNKLILRQREEYKNDQMVNFFTYEYAEDMKGSSKKLPIQRQCLKGDSSGQIIQYDRRGYISTGSSFRGVNPVRFTYWYRNHAKFEDELLRGEYILPHITIRVSWSMPPRNHPERLDDWIPFTKVTEATFIQGTEIHHATWTYDHRLHPEIFTTLNGESVPTPAMIREDWFKVLKKPTKCGFLSDNPLLSFSSAKSNPVTRLLGLNAKYYRVPTSHARTVLWKMWKGGRDLDAITARYLDEEVLREDRILKPYWRKRDLGLLDSAKAYLDVQADTIMARTDVDSEISSWVHIAFKIADYYSFGQGGDSRINTRSVTTQMKDSDDELHVLAMDTSTWPNEPGGVSACRRDLVNDLTTIKWHVVAETANDYGVPRFQIEKNVSSLTIIPQWGLDFLNPTHGILQNSLDSAIVQRSWDTRDADVEKNFLPILTSLVRCARTLNHTRQHIEEATKALVDLNTYFETSRNWNDVWSNDLVKQRWRELWLTEDMEDALPVSQWWDCERPTMQHMDNALNMWSRYLFIFSIPVPEKIPDVFQASHHFTGATYGILCKVKRNCTLHVWDHCISYREMTTFMSSAVSFDSPFVNSSLMQLGHIACVLLEHHADVVLPCCPYFNPGWEVELGSCEGAIQHRRTFARKIDPVVNGICNMEKFEPIKTIKSEKPTVVMLSHIQFVKDIKNAIMATDLIVNKWGFKDYNLHVYGDMERAAGLATECQELINAKGLREHCILKGLGNPSKVLQDAWIFLNSSISEGLPLAMGEAALMGIPVVCTDVGASYCVVTDQKTGDRFSEVCPPNDCESLARAQINVLGMIDRWAAWGEDAPGTKVPVLSYPNPSAEEVVAISQRIYDKVEQRRKLGGLGRTNVLKNFSEERYLREHEQMLWIGKYRSGAFRKRISRPTSFNNSSVWYLKEKPEFGAVVQRESRLPPEMWDAYASSMTLPNSSASSLRGWFKQERPSRPSTRLSFV